MLGYEFVVQNLVLFASFGSSGRRPIKEMMLIVYNLCHKMSVIKLAQLEMIFYHGEQ